MKSLIETNEAESEKLRSLIAEYPWHDPKAYANWLVQTYAMVNHSTRLVALAGAWAPMGSEQLHARFVDHSREERGHQLIAISDLKALGYTIDDFPRLPQAEAIYQIQYYWIQFRGAVSFLGYTLALETLAVKHGDFIYDKVKAAHGAKASVFMKVHSGADKEHLESAYEQLESLTPQELEMVAENLKLSANFYRSMMLDLTVQANDWRRSVA